MSENEDKTNTQTEFEIVQKKMKELEEEIARSKEGGLEREQKERLLQELKNFVAAAQGKNVFNIRISTTLRGAIFRLKRGIYALFNRTRKENPNFDLNESKKNWGAIASKIVEEANKRGVSNYPAKIMLTYDFEEKDGKIVFKPKEAKIIIFEPSNLFTIKADEE